MPSRSISLADLPPLVRAKVEAEYAGDGPFQRARDKRAANVARGIASQRNGREAEELIERHHALALNLGLARVDKLHPEVGGRHGHLFRKAASSVDYRGTLKGGRSLSIECKRTGNANVFQFSAIEPHQRVALNDDMAMGGLALLVVVLPEPSTALLAIEWRDVLGMVADRARVKRTTIPLEMLRDHCAARGTWEPYLAQWVPGEAARRIA